MLFLSDIFFRIYEKRFKVNGLQFKVLLFESVAHLIICILNKCVYQNPSCLGDFLQLIYLIYLKTPKTCQEFR